MSNQTGRNLKVLRFEKWSPNWQHVQQADRHWEQKRRETAWKNADWRNTRCHILNWYKPRLDVHGRWQYRAASCWELPSHFSTWHLSERNNSHQHWLTSVDPRENDKTYLNIRRDIWRKHRQTTKTHNSKSNPNNRMGCKNLHSARILHTMSIDGDEVRIVSIVRNLVFNRVLKDETIEHRRLILTKSSPKSICCPFKYSKFKKTSGLFGSKTMSSMSLKQAAMIQKRKNPPKWAKSERIQMKAIQIISALKRRIPLETKTFSCFFVHGFRSFHTSPPGFLVNRIRV